MTHATPTIDTQLRAEISTLCAAIGLNLKSVPKTRCEAAGLQPAEVTSVEGRPLLATSIKPKVRVADSAEKNIRPLRILMIGGIHGDEWASVSVVFSWISAIAQSDATSSRFHWRIIPLANPDGFLSHPSKRTNSHGVDINRNFSTRDWGKNARKHWAEYTLSDKRRNPGQLAASEPETRWLQQEISSFAPDVIVAVHAPYGVLDFDGPSQQAPERFGHLRLNQLGTYPGSLGNYAGIDRGIPVVTLEFPQSHKLPNSRALQKVWSDMVFWMNRYLRKH